MSEPHELTAVEQVAAIRRRELSPVELVEHYLARIEAYDGLLGAFVTITDEAARSRAKAVEVAATLREDLPPLAGLPVALKDLTATAGVRTSYGSLARVDHVPDLDADVVRLLAAAGTISLGKSATSEFGTTLYTETLLGPPARNPWRYDLSPGGSSGGAAVAVAAGLVSVAQGSDGGGSLRVPAALCGLVGFKPSRGLVSGGPGSGGFGLASNGPIGRTVGDVAALLDAMAEPVVGEPWLPPAPPPEGSYAAALRRPLGRLRVARYLDPPLYDTVPHPDCVLAWERASRLLAGLGHVVIDVPMPYPRGMLADFRVVQCALGAGPATRQGSAAAPAGDAAWTKMTRWLAAEARRYSGAEVLAAYGRLGAASRRAAEALAGFDLVLTPTVARPSVPIGYFAPLAPAADFDAQTEFSPYCSVYNVSGQPAVSLPVPGADAGPDGAPVSVMLAAPLGADAMVLAAAAALADSAGGGVRHPPIWSNPPSDTVKPG